MKRLLMSGIILVVLLTCVGAVSANLVTNGGFEAPIAANPWTTIFAGNGLTGWSIDSGSIDLIHNYWQPHSGDQSLDLSGNSPARISQMIPTTPGATYDLTFWMAGNPDIQEVKTLGVYWDGNELSPTITFDSTGQTKADMGWKLVTISGLKATTGSTELAFLDIQPQSDPCGVALDDISLVPAQVNPVPEFPGMALPLTLLVGLIGVVLFIRKSKEN
jgi:choice-of-anchor C domain-containing protein